MKSRCHTVLCVDDEVQILNSLKRLLRKEDYNLLTASSAAEGILVMNENDVSLVISDQRMPGESGIEFLTTIKRIYPEVIRILLSGYTDIDTITESVNKGHIYKLILKPWNDQNLILDIRQSLEQYELIQTNKALHKTVMEQNEELRVINDNLEMLVNMRTKDLEIQNKALQLSRVMIDDMPFPIIGISQEMIIVYKNKKACLLTDSTGFTVGSDISSSITAELMEKIRVALSYCVPLLVENISFFGKKYTFNICPLSEEFQGDGVFLVLY
jgi:response regulator RpfG family c-di-GMP phosphodiesterase